MTKHAKTSEKPLSIAEANRLARGRLRVERDDIDRSLWMVWFVTKRGFGWAGEVHEPMTREAWLAFVKAWKG